MANGGAISETAMHYSVNSVSDLRDLCGECSIAMRRNVAERAVSIQDISLERAETLQLLLRSCDRGSNFRMHRTEVGDLVVGPDKEGGGQRIRNGRRGRECPDPLCADGSASKP